LRKIIFLVTIFVSCERCNSVFKFPYLLKRHYARKIPCPRAEPEDPKLKLKADKRFALEAKNSFLEAENSSSEEKNKDVLFIFLLKTLKIELYSITYYISI
jgi:hypothetical protein